MDNEVSILHCTLNNHRANRTEQTAAVFVEGGVKLRQFSPVKLDLESNRLPC